MEGEVFWNKLKAEANLDPFMFVRERGVES